MNRVSIIGSITANGGIAAEVGASVSISGVVSVGAVKRADYPTYTGEVTVTPKARAQTVLATAQTVLASDITVLEIPYSEVDNISGTTVTIGE